MVRILLMFPVFLCLAAYGLPSYGQNSSLKELNERSARLYEQGSYAEAAELAEEALRKAETEFGQNDPQLTTFLNNLAAIYYGQGKYVEAKLLYKRALEIEGKNLNSDKSRLISLMKGMEKCRQKLTSKEELWGKSGTIGETGGQYASPSEESGNKMESTEGEKEAGERDPAGSKISPKIFKVQVGAFRSLSGAKSLQERLYEKGYHAYITSSVLEKRKSIYRVQIGEFSEREQAIAASGEITNNTGLNTFVTTN